MLDQQHLNNYFGKIWSQRDRSLDQYQYSGYALVDKVLPGQRVVDVGCGFNPFKNYIPNLIGVDPAFDQADFRMTIEEYAQVHYIQRFHVAFCLGSINFGTQEDIERQIACVIKILHRKDAKIFWRCNPALADHGNAECETVPFYPWSFDEQVRLAELFGFSIVEMDWDNGNRIYAEWHSKNVSQNAVV